MPGAAVWDSFFDPAGILTALGLDASAKDVLDLGCGYGTFTVAAAQLTAGTVVGLDLDAEMLRATRRRAEALDLCNVVLRQRDFVDTGSGLPAESTDFVMLFNILHGEHPERLVEEAWRVLRPGGMAAAVHWVADPATPRGPPLEIRPVPEQVVRWLEAAGFRVAGEPVALPPWHFGVTGGKPSGASAEGFSE